MYSLIKYTVFQGCTCVSGKGRGGGENAVWPNSPGSRGSRQDLVLTSQILDLH